MQHVMILVLRSFSASALKICDLESSSKCHMPAALQPGFLFQRAACGLAAILAIAGVSLYISDHKS
jgi:hypothetical protein